jgi:hypothetical protein
VRGYIVLVQETRRGIPCSLENDMPSSKSSSQLSVCSSGCRKTAGRGSARGAAFFAAAGGTTFLAADKAGNRLNEEERAAGEEDSLNRGLTGEAGASCCRETSKGSRPPCFEGREGAVYQTCYICSSVKVMHQNMRQDLHLRASFHSCTLSTASSKL